MNEFKENFLEIFKNKNYIFLSIFTFIIISLIFWYFTDSELIKGNIGVKYFYILITSQILISFFFAIFLSAFYYKFKKFNIIETTENKTSFSALFLGILVAGCPACSISIASYIGLAGLISLFPYYGLELKIIAIPMLIYANYSTIKNLNTCQINQNKKKKIF